MRRNFARFRKIQKQTFDEIFRCLSLEEPKKLPEYLKPRSRQSGPFMQRTPKKFEVEGREGSVNNFRFTHLIGGVVIQIT